MDYKERAINAFLNGYISLYFDNEKDLYKFCDYCNSKNITWVEFKSGRMISKKEMKQHPDFDKRNYGIEFRCYKHDNNPYEIKWYTSNRTARNCNLFREDEVILTLQHVKNETIKLKLKILEEFKVKYEAKVLEIESEIIKLNEL